MDRLAPSFFLGPIAATLPGHGGIYFGDRRPTSAIYAKINSSSNQGKPGVLKRLIQDGLRATKATDPSHRHGCLFRRGRAKKAARADRETPGHWRGRRPNAPGGGFNRIL